MLPTSLATIVFSFFVLVSGLQSGPLPRPLPGPLPGLLGMSVAEPELPPGWPGLSRPPEPPGPERSAGSSNRTALRDLKRQLRDRYWKDTGRSIG